MNSRIVLPLSLALNFVCLGGLLWRNKPLQTTSEPAPPPDSVPVVAERLPQPAAPAFHWSQVESTNYFAYIANLRAVGCPEQTIRDIISADLVAAMRGQPAVSPTGAETSQGIAQTQADRLVNHLMHPQTVPLQGRATQEDPLLSSAEIPSAAPDIIAERERVAANLEKFRLKRFEAIQRIQLADSIRARYGNDALLGWQQQASREGISFDEFVQRYQVSVPPVPPQR